MQRDDVIETPSHEEPLDDAAIAQPPPAPGLAGARDVLPLLVGVLPLAMVIGVTARSTGIDLTAAWAASFLLIAGSAQLSMIQLLHEGAAPVSIVATATVINARFVVYSLGFRSWFEHEPMGRRLLLAFPLVDQLFLVCQQRFHEIEDPIWRRRYYLAAAGVLVGGWAGAQALSIAFAGSLPPSTLFEAATPIVFLGFLVPAVVDRPTAATVAAAAFATVAGSQLPFHSGLVVGIVGGVAAGVIAQGRRR